MRRGRILIFLLLIVVIGLVVVFVAARTFLAARAPQAQVPQSVEVFVAGQNIPQGATITEDELATITLPQDKVSAVEFTADEKAQLLNMVAKYPLEQGVVITSAMVSTSAQAVAIAGPQWAALIPPGMTAISIPSSRLALASFGINDGAHVNLNACFLFVDVDPTFQSMTPDNTAILTATGFPQNALPILSLGVAAPGGVQGRLELDQSLQQPFFLSPSEPQRPRPVCQTILQDVVVMKLGDFPLTPTDTQAAQQQQQQQQQRAAALPDLVTLIVSPQDAVTLQYML
jgi:pilus assembly protein CpaB